MNNDGPVVVLDPKRIRGYWVGIRHTREQGEKMRGFAPLGSNHPIVTSGTFCPACEHGFLPGDITTLIPLGPGDDPEMRARARDGRPYNAIAAVLHFACAFGMLE